MELAATLRRLRPYILMLLLQFGFAGIHIISVTTLKEGMSHYVLVVYRNIVAVIVVLPFALWFERKTRPKMSIAIFFKIMAMALMEIVLDQNLYYIGVNFTSASFAAALIKIPAIPFVLALFLRIEKLNLRQRSHQAKVIGNIVTVAGALVMIFYKGPIVKFIWSKGLSHIESAATHNSGDWLKGTIALLASAVCCAGFVFLQSNTLRTYPAILSVTASMCFVGTLMSTAVALVTEHGNSKAWTIGLDTRLFAAVYSGVVCTGVAYYVQGVVMKERDAVFVTAFNPLCMIIVVFLGSIILGEVITLGRLLGMGIIVIGLYFFIWGKSKDFVASISDVNAKEALGLPKTQLDTNIAMGIPALPKSSMNADNISSSTNSNTVLIEVPDIQNN